MHFNTLYSLILLQRNAGNKYTLTGVFSFPQPTLGRFKIFVIL